VYYGAYEIFGVGILILQLLVTQTLFNRKISQVAVASGTYQILNKSVKNTTTDLR